jgi:CBS domain-containing protein
MSPQTFGTSVLRTVPLLDVARPLREAVAEVLAAGVPALPVVEGPEGRLRGIFGEREFFHALFPGWVDTLGYAGFVPRSLDRVLEQRQDCGDQPVGRWMTTDHVDVGPDVSDAGLAETFLHHRVLIVPVVDARRVTGVVTRADFFRALAERFAQLG